MNPTRFVHYSRREYAEYLKTDEWRNLRGLVMSAAHTCQCCKVALASEVHHMDYRNIVDVRVTDLLPVCDACHTLIHKAIRLHIIPKQQIHERCRALIVNHAALSSLVAKRAQKSVIKKWLANMINMSDLHTQRLVCGVMRILHPGDFTTLVGAKVSNATIAKVRMVLFSGRAICERSAAMRARKLARREANRRAASSALRSGSPCG